LPFFKKKNRAIHEHFAYLVTWQMIKPKVTVEALHLSA